MQEPRLPRVSALVTTFNHERFIESAIESLLDQTYPAAEIIIVDDGSQDRTFELASAFSDRGVRVLQGPGEGPSMAMNLAMSEAGGDIFLLQSGDDMSSPLRVERQVHTLESAELTASFPNLIDAAGDRLEDHEFMVFFRMHSVENMSDLFKSLYHKGNFICASSVAMRRSVWEHMGGFHAGLIQLQDYEYWMRALTHGFSFAIAPERLASYRLHGLNLSRPQHDIRVERELAALFRNLSPLIPTTLLKTILYGNSFNGIAWQPDDRHMLLALFFLGHGVESVRQIGYDGLIEIMKNPTSAAALTEKFGLSYRDIFQMLLQR